MVTNSNIYEMSMLDAREQYKARTQLQNEQAEMDGRKVAPTVLATANKIVQKVKQRRSASVELEKE